VWTRWAYIVDLELIQMVMKQDKPKADATVPVKKEGARIGKATPIKIVKRDTPLREQGLKILAKFYMGEMDLELVKKRVFHHEGRQIGDTEAVLALLTELIRNADDPQMKARLMESVAEFQSLCGMDPRPVLAEMHRQELRIYKELGFEAVIIECKKDACPACKPSNGKKLTIDMANEMMPLPHPACTKRAHAKAAPFCRCRYFGEYRG
jgi:hypothetical protein